MCKLSFIIPCYNCEAFVRKCTESILSLDGLEYEIICVNDGSKDNTLAVLQAAAQANPRVIVVDKTNGGVSSARNAGLETARGEYVAFVDADDHVEWNKVPDLPQLLETNADLLLFPYRKNGQTICPWEEEHFSEDRERLYDYLYQCQINAVWTKIVKRSIIADHNLRFDPEMKMGEDLLFVGDCVRHAASYYLCSRAYYQYYCNPDSAVHKYIDQYIFDFCKMFRVLSMSKLCTEKRREMLAHGLFYGFFNNVWHNRKMCKETVSHLKNSLLIEEIKQLKCRNWKQALKKHYILWYVAVRG